MRKFLKVVWKVLEVIYFPIYVAFWLLHKIARFLLAISYFGMLEGRMGKDIIHHLFDWHGRH